MDGNNIPLSLFCYALNKFIEKQNLLSKQLDTFSLNGVKCEVYMELLDHLQPSFIFLINIHEIYDKYDSEEINLRLSFTVCLNKRSGYFEIDVDFDEFKALISSSTKGFMEIFKKAEALFESRLESLFDVINEWESEKGYDERMVGQNIELAIHESRIENNYMYSK